MKMTGKVGRSARTARTSARPSRTPGQLDVGKQHVDLASGRQHVDSLVATFRLDHLVAFVGEHLGQREADEELVLDDQDTRRACGGSRRRRRRFDAHAAMNVTAPLSFGAWRQGPGAPMMCHGCLAYRRLDAAAGRGCRVGPRLADLARHARDRALAAFGPAACIDRTPAALAGPAAVPGAGAVQPGRMGSPSVWLLLLGQPGRAMAVYVGSKILAGGTALWIYLACEPALLRVPLFAAVHRMLGQLRRAALARLRVWLRVGPGPPRFTARNAAARPGSGQGIVTNCPTAGQSDERGPPVRPRRSRCWSCGGRAWAPVRTTVPPGVIWVMQPVTSVATQISPALGQREAVEALEARQPADQPAAMRGRASPACAPRPGASMSNAHSRPVLGLRHVERRAVRRQADAVRESARDRRPR